MSCNCCEDIRLEDLLQRALDSIRENTGSLQAYKQRYYELDTILTKERVKVDHLKAEVARLKARIKSRDRKLKKANA